MNTIATNDSGADAPNPAESGLAKPGAGATDSPPDRLSIDPDSPHFNEKVLSRDIGVRFKGVERSDVEEYCISEGWIKVAAGRATDRRGKSLLIKLKGDVKPYFKLPA